MLDSWVLYSETAPAGCQVPLPGAGGFPQPQHLSVSPVANDLGSPGLCPPPEQCMYPHAAVSAGLHLDDVQLPKFRSFVFKCSMTMTCQ